MSTDAHNSDSLLRQLGGCNRFQVLFTACVSMTYVTVSYTAMFMAFGSYNPGWRCLDKNSSNTELATNFTSDSFVGNTPRWTVPNNDSIATASGFTETCIGFSDCRNVEFNPESSTIVTEWGLACGHTWKVSLISFLQMAGLSIGNFMGGSLGDAIGRKLTIYINVFIHSILTFVSVASVSWEMFAALRFFLGVSCGVVFGASIVYMIEFVTPKWRTVIPSLPLWCLGCMIFSLCAAVSKDWREIHVFNGVLSLFLLLPALKFPESLRWLAVKTKEKKTHQAVSQIAKINNIDETTLGSLSFLFSSNRPKEGATNTCKKINFTQLFRKRRRFVTVILLLAIFTSCLIYYSTSFGLAMLPGDIYTNSIIVFATELPANVIASVLPNIIGRKLTGIVFQLGQAVCMLVFLAFEYFSTGSFQEIGVLIATILLRLCTDVTFFLVVILANELYPTVIRSMAVGWMMFTGGVGGMISPFMILRNDVMRISYLVMALLSLIGCGLFVFLPGTLGKDLEDDLSDDDGYDKCPENDAGTVPPGGI